MVAGPLLVAGISDSMGNKNKFGNCSYSFYSWVEDACTNKYSHNVKHNCDISCKGEVNSTIRLYNKEIWPGKVNTDFSDERTIDLWRIRLQRREKTVFQAEGRVMCKGEVGKQYKFLGKKKWEHIEWEGVCYWLNLVRIA